MLTVTYRVEVKCWLINRLNLRGWISVAMVLRWASEARKVIVLDALLAG